MTLGLKVELVVQGRGMHVLGDKDIDLLVFDYGGASSLGSDDTCLDQFETACKWAEEHPGRLLLLWTTFTVMLYRRGIKDNHQSANVLWRFDPNNTSQEADDRHRKRIKAWFAGGDFERGEREG